MAGQVGGALRSIRACSGPERLWTVPSAEYSQHPFPLQGGGAGVLGQGATEDRGETARMVGQHPAQTAAARGGRAAAPVKAAAHARCACTHLRMLTAVKPGAAQREGTDRAAPAHDGCPTTALRCCFCQAAFIGAVAVADLVKSTLGPKGMDKILQSLGRGQEVTVTNDGATILKSIHVDNPAAKVLVGE
jgi:hypothetical protein